jgi:hypothetical protein
MAGRLTVTTLNDDTGVLAVQNGMSGIAKAWVNFNGTGTVAIRGSFNVSSITDNGTGNYQVNFTTAMPDANYATVALISLGNRGWAQQRSPANTTSSTNIRAIQEGSGEVDSDAVYVAIFR